VVRGEKQGKKHGSLGAMAHLSRVGRGAAREEGWRVKKKKRSNWGGKRHNGGGQSEKRGYSFIKVT